MRRRLFTFCSALSLLLCVAVCVLWVRSWRHWDTIAFRGLGAASYEGGIHLWTLSPPPNHSVGVLGGWHRGWNARTVKIPPPDPPPTLYVQVSDRLLFKQVSAPPFPTRRRRVRWRGFGFAYTDGQYAGRGLSFRRRDMHGITVPFYAIVGILSILPATRLVSITKRRIRFKSGHCPTCGYDLRATPGTCPECGTAVSAKEPPVSRRRPPPPAPSSPSSR